MGTLMVGVAAMVSVMEPTTDAEEKARCTLGAADLDVCLHLDDHIIKSSA